MKQYHVRILPFGKPILSCTVEAIGHLAAINRAWAKVRAFERVEDYIEITVEEVHDATQKRYDLSESTMPGM